MQPTSEAAGGREAEEAGEGGERMNGEKGKDSSFPRLLLVLLVLFLMMACFDEYLIFFIYFPRRFQSEFRGRGDKKEGEKKKN